MVPFRQLDGRSQRYESSIVALLRHDEVIHLCPLTRQELPC